MLSVEKRKQVFHNDKSLHSSQDEGQNVLLCTEVEKQKSESTRCCTHYFRNLFILCVKTVRYFPFGSSLSQMCNVFRFMTQLVQHDSVDSVA